jgi:hypothetical protein
MIAALQALNGCEDRRQRRAQLVAQHRHEMILCPAGILGGFLGCVQLGIDLHPLGHIALNPPGSHQFSILHRPHEVVHEVLGFARAIDFIRQRLAQSIAAADECHQEFQVARIRFRQHVPQPRSDQPRRRLLAVHPRHRVIAFGEVSVLVKKLDLLLLRQLGVDRLIQLESPDALGALLDEPAIALLASRQLILGPFARGDVGEG